MPNDNSPPARLIADGAAVSLYRSPATLPATRPGAVTIVLGSLPSGAPVTVTVTSRAWLVDLAAAAADGLAAFRPVMSSAVTP